MKIHISAEAVIVNSFRIPGCEIETMTIFKPSKATREALAKAKQLKSDCSFKITDGPKGNRLTFVRDGFRSFQIIGYNYEERLNVLDIAIR